MPTDGYMDAAAVPVPDAGDDMLRDEMARTITASLHGGRWIDMTPRKIADALLPRIREHIAAAVQAEREQLLRRAADVLEHKLDEFPAHGRHTRATWAVNVLRSSLMLSELDGGADV